ncbi:MAG TPA: SUF system NifU family Fe-S cluster assembly protein [Acidimicrobiales bacterium]|nr:SUF system NifU family Fe-S cluster assembly protein [Acidimicrobiales bacterium]
MTDLEDLYREIILDHYRSPRNRGELESPPAHRVEGFNPLCGDEIVLTLLAEGGQVTDIKFAGSGCSISQSSASLMSSAVKGKTLEEARRLIRTFKSMMSIHEAALADGDDDDEADDGDDGGEGRNGSGGNGSGGNGSGGGGLADVRKLGELAALQGVVKFPVRIKCATLSWNALTQALDEVDG